MPFKTFTASVLSSSDVNTYLMKQTVITCTSGTRPASPVEGMTIYETDTDMYATYDGAAWGYLGGWKSYTPTLSNWSQGNGTLTGSYAQIGKTVHFKITFTAGTTSTFVGSPQFSIPVAASFSATVNETIGTATLRDTSAPATQFSLTIHATNTSVTAVTNANAFLSATSPWTWATGDIVIMRGTYDAA